MHEGEHEYYITDTSLVDLAEHLSATAPPLISMTRGSGSGGQWSVALTNTARDVLSGRLDRVAACGIDRWLGGVHLRSGFPVWRWDDQHRRITRS
jgi:hypothetical protein